MIFIFPFVSMRKSMVVDDKAVWFVGRKRPFRAFEWKSVKGLVKIGTRRWLQKNKKRSWRIYSDLRIYFKSFMNIRCSKNLQLEYRFSYFLFLCITCVCAFFSFFNLHTNLFGFFHFFFFAGISQLFLRTSSCFNALAYVSDNYLYSRRAPCFLPVFSTLFHTCFLRKFRKIIKIQHTDFITVRIIILRKE